MSDGGSDASATDAAQDGADNDGGGGSGARRDLTVRARDLGSHMGRPLAAWLIDDTGHHVLGYGIYGTIDGPEVEIRMPDLVPEGDYRADIFVDANGNGSYDGPATDPSWRVRVPTTGSANAVASTMDPTVDLMSPARVPRADFTATLSGFTSDEQGQHFALRVIDQGTMATVGTYILPQLGASDLTIRLPGIVEEGSSYNVDFWVDTDRSGTYSGPPADHAWRVTTTATGSGAEARWTRSDSYEEIGWR